MNPPELVWCNDCHQELPAHQFAARLLSKNKKQPRCLDCASRRIGKWKTKKKVKELKSSGQLLLFEAFHI